MSKIMKIFKKIEFGSVCLYFGLSLILYVLICNFIGHLKM